MVILISRSQTGINFSTQEAIKDRICLFTLLYSLRVPPTKNHRHHGGEPPGWKVQRLLGSTGSLNLFVSVIDELRLFVN